MIPSLPARLMNFGRGSKRPLPWKKFVGWRGELQFPISAPFETCLFSGQRLIWHVSPSTGALWATGSLRCQADQDRLLRQFMLSSILLRAPRSGNEARTDVCRAGRGLGFWSSHRHGLPRFPGPGRSRARPPPSGTVGSKLDHARTFTPSGLS